MGTQMTPDLERARSLKRQTAVNSLPASTRQKVTKAKFLSDMIVQETRVKGILPPIRRDSEALSGTQASDA